MRERHKNTSLNGNSTAFQRWVTENDETILAGDGRIFFRPYPDLIFLLIVNAALKRWAIFHSSHPALSRRPDELVHLELKPDIETIGQDPFHDFARIDSTENRRKQNGVTTLGKIEL
jgi:hypothetical protein